MIYHVADLVPDPNTTDIRPEVSYYDRACRLWGINEFVISIRDYPSVAGSEIQIAATNLHSLLRFHTTILLNLHRCACDIEFAKDFFYVTSPTRAKVQIKNTNSMNRLSFATMANFFIEGILRNLIRKLGGVSPDGFYKTAQKIIELASLPDPHNEHLHALTVVSKFRNTLHNGGVYQGYNGSNAHFKLEGVQYKFNHGSSARGYSTWDHLAHALACALKTILEILENKFPR